MKFYSIYIAVFFAYCSCNSPTAKDIHPKQNDVIPTVQETNQKTTSSFELSYSYAALGSGMGSMQPAFRVRGTDFVYNLEQTSSFTGKFDKKPELLCTGKLRASSIDSIINLVKDIKDTLVYKTDIRINSGGIQYITVKNDKINVSFKLHNAVDSTANKIVDILNSNIPADKRRL